MNYEIKKTFHEPSLQDYQIEYLKVFRLNILQML